MDKQKLLHLLDSINFPIVFVDTKHVIRYTNKKANERYIEQKGDSDLIGKSVLDYHKSESKEKLIKLFERMLNGEDEIYLTLSDEKEHIYMVAVRDEKGDLIGYYERFEKGT